ncbi:hypothetical protein BG004_003642 [Podila humilis]|nr:hypothetical protein BG004_003642 [Podila humilis]
MGNETELTHPTPGKIATAALLNNNSMQTNGAVDPNNSTVAAASGTSTPSSSSSPGPVSADLYFATHVAPKSLTENAEKIRAFVDKHMHEGRRVVLVTFSLQPYSRHYSHARNCFLDFMEADDQGIHVTPSYVEKMRPVLEKYKATQNAGTLLSLNFLTVNDYLFLLREAARIISRMDVNAMYYLAAAVSDFFIPADKMSEHKIQSGDGTLNLTMEQVPKILKPLVNDWTPKAFIVSFKLETDEALLPMKSRQALKRYGHQIVIGNILTTRKRLVNMITMDDACEIHLTQEEDEVQHIEIESRIVPELIKRHSDWIEACGKHGHCGIRTPSS